MEFGVILDNWPLYLEGLVTTVELTGLCLILGLLLAIPLGTVQAVGPLWARGLVFAYSYVFRGTPLLVQTFLIYYGLGQFEAVQQSVFWPLLKEAYWCALIAFTLNTGAYTTEILAGALRAMPHGEIEAARACGMSRFTMLRRILLPGALRRALPAYSNEIIFMLHGTSIASTVTLIDLTGAARNAYSQFFAPFEAFIFAGLIYLAITFALVGLFRIAERRWLAHLQPRKPLRKAA